MPEYVRITDVAPRDGLQNEPAIVPPRDKARLIELLASTGVDEIEATSFVSPKWIPQLGDAEEVLTLIKQHWPPPPGGRGTGVGQFDPPSRREGPGVGPSGAHTPHTPIPDTRLPPLPPRQQDTIRRADVLRRSMTAPERHLWSHVRGKRLDDLKFRRQHPFGPYVLDFYCQEALLAIEVDGRTHDGAHAAEEDAQRQAWIEAHGVCVLRFTNDQVLTALEAVLREIRRIAAERRDEARRGAGGRTAGRRSTPLAPPAGRGHREPPVDRGPTPLPPPSGRGRPTLTVLVPNAQGFDRALAIHRAGLPLKIAVFTAASETFSQKNTNATIAQTIERFGAFLPRAFEEDMEVRMYISCAVACPFEGAVSPDAVRQVADMLLALAPDWADEDDLELDLGDTIGAATEQSITDLLSAFSEEHMLERTVLHLHDTFGHAAACVRRGLELGVRRFDGSVAGLGGCPYAGRPGQPAPGNIATETLVRTIHGEGYETGVDLERLAEAAAEARRMIDVARAHGGGT